MEKFTRGAFVRCFLSSLISRSLPPTYFHVHDRYRHWVHDTRPTFPFPPFPFFLPPPLLSSFLSQQFARHRRRSWWKKRGGLNLKNVGQKDGNEVNALTKREKRKIYGNLVKRLPKLIRFFNE